MLEILSDGQCKLLDSSFQWVSRVFDQREFQGSFKGILRMFQGTFKGVPRKLLVLLPGRLKGVQVVLRGFQGC